MSFENKRSSAYCTWRYPNKKAELANDDIFVRGPHRIGNSILIYGRKNTSFPYQAFVRFTSIQSSITIRDDRFVIGCLIGLSML